MCIAKLLTDEFVYSSSHTRGE